jgi:hypothetical protein
MDYNLRESNKALDRSTSQAEGKRNHRREHKEDTDREQLCRTRNFCNLNVTLRNY